MANFQKERLLVTGAGGQLGRKIIEELLRLEAGSLVVTTRDSSKLSYLAARGVQDFQADFDNPDTLRPAFKGVSRTVLVSTDALHTPGQRLQQHRNAIKVAIESGVRHIVYTSVPNRHPTPEWSVPNDHFWTEVALFESQLDWTILRNNLYSEVMLMWARNISQTGELVTAVGTAGRSYVSRDDCARTAAQALLSCSGREIHDVTGPVSITQDELAAELSTITGVSVTHRSVSPNEVEQWWLDSGMPPAVARSGYHFDHDAAQGYHAIVSSTVERLTGQKPVSPLAFLQSQQEEIRRLAKSSDVSSA